MTDGIVYRIPTTADAAAIARLHVGCWREAYAEIVPVSVLENVDMDDRTARWKAHVSRPGATVVLAEAEGVPAGFIHRGVLDEPLAEGADGHINALYILRRFHRRGIGRSLVGKVAADWLARGGKALSVGVLTANRPAVAFYEALGAQFVRPDIYRWNDHDLAESIYVFNDLGGLAQGP